MSKEIGIGKANRLARVGEMVSVSINGTTITAKVATNLSSTKVLILFDGRTYHAYPESQRAILRSQKTVLAKHERRKNIIKATPSVVIVYFVPGGNSRSYYVTINGVENRYLATVAHSGDTLPSQAFVTNLGSGRYRGAIKYGRRIITGEDSNGFYTRHYYGNTIVFTEQSTQSYGYNSRIPSVAEDWQDLRVRAWTLNLIDKDIDTTGIHPCLDTNRELGYFQNPRADWTTTTGIATNYDTKKQLHFTIGTEVAAWYPGLGYPHPHDSLSYRLSIGGYPNTIYASKYSSYQTPEYGDDFGFCRISLYDPGLTTPCNYPRIRSESTFVVKNVSPHVSWS